MLRVSSEDHVFASHDVSGLKLEGARRGRRVRVQLKHGNVSFTRWFGKQVSVPSAGATPAPR